MVVSVTNWFAAGGLLDQIRNDCEAIIRGDQPEKIDHLPCLTYMRASDLLSIATMMEQRADRGILLTYTLFSYIIR